MPETVEEILTMTACVIAHSRGQQPDFGSIKGLLTAFRVLLQKRHPIFKRLTGESEGLVLRLVLVFSSYRVVSPSERPPVPVNSAGPGAVSR